VFAAEDYHQSGRGLRIVEQCSQSCGVTEAPLGGKSVWARLALQ